MLDNLKNKIKHCYSMAKLTAEILEGDEESDLASFFIKACGLNYRDFLDDDRILTKDIFEKNFKNIMQVVERRSSRRKTYLILGYFILLTGARLPNDLKVKIIDAANWEHEEGLWEEMLIQERRFYLSNLKEKIQTHRVGQSTRLVSLKNVNNEDFNLGVIGLNQFRAAVKTGKIHSLKHINLDCCNLTSIPEPIFELGQLETLSLEYNEIKEIPESICKLKSLERLFLSGNQLRALPSSLGELDSLRILFLEENKIETIPDSIIHLKSLKEVFLRKNNFTKFPEILRGSHIFVEI